jgi:hypothetical protein
MRVDDRFPFRLGDIVAEVEGRHEAIVVSVISDEACVRWLDTGWRSRFLASDLRLVRRANTSLSYNR